MQQISRTIHTCPKCGKRYKGHPALSREDNETLICPLCGTREALDSLGISPEEREEIVASVIASMEEGEKEQECLE